MFLQVPLLMPCFQEKRLYHLHKLCIKKRWSKILRPLISLLFLTKKDKTFKARINIYAEIGSPKAWSNEWKTFSISIYNKNPLLRMSVISMLSAINQLLSPINRSFHAKQCNPGHDSSQNLITICQVVTIYMKILA